MDSTATGFNKTIENIKYSNALLKFVFDSLGGSSNDIEKILFTLEEFNRDDNSTFNIIKRVIESSRPYGAKIMGSISSLKTQIKNSIISVKKEIFETLNNFNREDSFSLYYNLFKEIKTAIPGYKISFYTTNYDLTFDDAFHRYSDKWNGIGIKGLNDFFIRDRGRLTLRPSVVNDSNEAVKFVKMHGSLDWHYDHEKNITKSGSVTTPSDPNLMPLIYPGFKGFIEDEPFKTFHDHFAFDLNEADAVIFIGFSFRDQFINFILEITLRRRLDNRNTLWIHCFNPAHLDEYPLDSRLPYFADKFKDIFFLYHEYFQIKENPLSIIGKGLSQPFR